MAPIDIIIPVFDRSQNLERCINSVLTARCDCAVEVIVIADLSTGLDVKDYLLKLSNAGRITLNIPPKRLDFTDLINVGLKLHPDRDVVVLRRDVQVYDGWLERIAAHAGDRVATVSPLTNQTGWDISGYPQPLERFRSELETSDAALAVLAAEMNSGKKAFVHRTEGFCMFIRRACLNDIGYFDKVNFPQPDLTEADFCLRASQMGWRHVIAGDVFVTEREGQSDYLRATDEREKLVRLHPQVDDLEADFRRRDPVRILRSGLDVARIKLMLGGSPTLALVLAGEEEGAIVPAPGLYGVFCTAFAIHIHIVY